MKINYELLFVCCLIIQSRVSGLPFLLSSTNNANRRQVIEWQTPNDDWNITNVPRSITPFLKAKNSTGSYVQPKIPSHEELLLQRLQEIKVKSVWRDNTAIFQLWQIKHVNLFIIVAFL